MGTRRRSRVAAACAAVGVATLLLALSGRPAAADPPLPAAADPAASAVSPLADEVPPCGHLSLGLVAVDVAVQTVTATVGPALPPTVSDAVLSAYGQAFLTAFKVDSAACEAIPARQFETTCDADDQMAGAIAGVPMPGLPVELGVVRLPTEPALVGALLDAIAAVERETSAPASPSETLAGPLGCETVERLAGSPVTPGLGSVDVDLSPPPAKETFAGTSQVLDRAVERVDNPPTPRRPIPATAATGAASSTPPAVATAAEAVPVGATNSGDDDTRRKVYFALFLLVAGAAVIGFGTRTATHP